MEAVSPFRVVGSPARSLRRYLAVRSSTRKSRRGASNGPDPPS
jgi:hypothetical protein